MNNKLLLFPKIFFYFFLIFVIGYIFVLIKNVVIAQNVAFNPVEKAEIQTLIRGVISLNNNDKINISKQSKMSEKFGIIAKCNSDIDFENMRINQVGQDRLKVAIKEKRYCEYESGGPIEEGFYDHSFFLSKNKKWKIDEFEDGSKFRVMPPSKIDKGFPPILSPEEAISKQKPIENNLTAQSASYAYDRNYAAWYGSYYALTPNTAFRNFSNSGGDCTNFISQAVWYGHWPMAGWWPNISSSSVWWYDFGWTKSQSYTWTSANHWYRFISDRRGYLTGSFCYLQKGDIIQADWNKDGSIDHSMIVTYKNGCDIRVSYHSNNTRDKSIWDIYNANQNAWYYNWKLHDFFYY